MVLPACAALLALVYYFDFTQDDAYITFRYAANYTAGHGLVYNIGEHVEGYTNFLWTILMVLGRLAGFELVFFSKVLGTLFGVGTIILCYVLGRFLFAEAPNPWRTLLPGLSSLFLGLTLSFAYWTVAGLETAAFSFMVTASLYAYLRRSYLAIPCLVLATLLRPEGGLLWIFVIAAELISRRSLTRYILLMAGLYLLYLLPLAIFKYSYYGGLLPNPFYAKTSFQWEQVVNGLSYVGQYGYHYLGAGLFLLPALWGYRRSSRSIRLVIIFVAVYTFYIILIGGDVLKVHRFFVPLMPLIILIVLYGMLTTFRKTIFLIPGMMILLAAQMYLPLEHVTTYRRSEYGLTRKMNFLMSGMLAIDQSNFSLAVSTVGIVGYRLLGHRVIDLLGLTDSTIARHPETEIEGMETTWQESHFNSRYVLTCQPDYILFSTGIKASAPAERALFLYSQFLNKYRTIGFEVGKQLHQIYKRYYPINSPVDRDVSPEFEEAYNLGIRFYNWKDYKNSLDALHRALLLSPQPVYPYVYAFIGEACGGLNNKEGQLNALRQMAQLDTLVFEAPLDLYYYELNCGHQEQARFYRDRVAKLAPWCVPAMDDAARTLRQNRSNQAIEEWQ